MQCHLFCTLQHYKTLWGGLQIWHLILIHIFCTWKTPIFKIFTHQVGWYAPPPFPKLPSINKYDPIPNWKIIYLKQTLITGFSKVTCWSHHPGVHTSLQQFLMPKHWLRKIYIALQLCHLMICRLRYQNIYEGIWFIPIH